MLPVREYQPCPSTTPVGLALVPTYPGQISLTLEPLIIRRRCFSHRIRYSCLHSHSCRLHPWITPDFTGGTTLPYPSTHLNQPDCSTNRAGGLVHA